MVCTCSIYFLKIAYHSQTNDVFKQLITQPPLTETFVVVVWNYLIEILASKYIWNALASIHRLQFNTVALNVKPILTSSQYTNFNLGTLTYPPPPPKIGGFLATSCNNACVGCHLTRSLNGLTPACQFVDAPTKNIFAIHPHPEGWGFLARFR